MFGSKNLQFYLWGAVAVVCICFYSVAVKTPDTVETQDFASLFQTQNLASLQAQSQRQTLRRIYTAEIGVREATNNNDGKRVGEYLAYVNLPQGYAHCAAFVSWTFGQAGMAQPKTAWSPALFPNNRLTSNPQTGDVFGIYFSELKRVAHCGFVDEWSDTWVLTVESNTNDAGVVTYPGDPANPIRAGPPNEGVYRKKRLVKTIYKVADWVR